MEQAIVKFWNEIKLEEVNFCFLQEHVFYDFGV